MKRLFRSMQPMQMHTFFFFFFSPVKIDRTCTTAVSDPTSFGTLHKYASRILLHPIDASDHSPIILKVNLDRSVASVSPELKRFDNPDTAVDII